MESTVADKSYAHELGLLKEKLSAMANVVEDLIAQSVQGLVQRDKELAHNSIRQATKLHDMEVEIDNLCLDILSKQINDKADLGFVSLAIKVVNDLERIGDLASGIGQRAMELSYIPPLKPYIDIPKMAVLSREMLQEVMTAFFEGDSEKAAKIIDRDDEVDELYHRTKVELIEIMEQKGKDVIVPGTRVMAVTKYLERIADRIVNIAVHIRFVLNKP
jgi:phosphate transport system protein